MLIEPKFVEAFVNYFSGSTERTVSPEFYNELVSKFNSLLKYTQELEISSNNLQEANKQLTTTLKKVLEEKNKLSHEVDKLTTTSVNDHTSITTKVKKILNYRQHLIDVLGKGDSLENLTTSAKRDINLKLLAFTELIHLSDGMVNYAKRLNLLNERNVEEELRILSKAITQDNALEIPAITAYGYLSMMAAYLENMNSVYNSYDRIHGYPDEAYKWLVSREKQLQDASIYIGSTSEIDLKKIPPIFAHPSELRKHDLDVGHRVSVSLSNNSRESFDQFIHRTEGKWPSYPTASELQKGPVEPSHDIGLVWMAEEQDKRVELNIPEQSIIENILSGDYDPILMNAKAGKTELQAAGQTGLSASDFVNDTFSKITLK